MTHATQTNRNEQMYGFADFDAFIVTVKGSISYRFSGANMVVAGLMSDAQEQMAFGDVESARKTLNIAKSIIVMVMDGDLVGTVERK